MYQTSLKIKVGKLFLLLSFFCSFPSFLNAKDGRPNIIYILVDDLGYGDVNLNIEGLDVFRNPFIKTPNLANFASQGLVFTHHYSASPVCSPSRAGLLTGRTPTRSNINLWINDRNFNGQEFLRDEEKTIAEIGVNAGYETAIFGKWHLNCADWNVKANWEAKQGTFPNQQGFQHGMVSKENPHLTIHLNSNSQKNPGDFFSVKGEHLGTIKGYTSAIITDSSLNWLANRDTDNPFFLYIPFDAPHERIYNPDEYDEIYDTGDPNKDVYFANITFLDHQIGRLLNGIEKLGIANNTIIFFSSDNGPEVLRQYFGTWRSYGTSFPLKGQKRTLWEGGIRVPGIVRWPGKIKAGISSEPNSTLDVLPTICELIGTMPPNDRELDGASMVGHLLRNESIDRQKPLYWQFEYPDNWLITGEGYNKRYDGTRQDLSVNRPTVAVRYEHYMLRGMYKGKFQKPDNYVLYDVVSDIEEKEELSKTRPDLFQKMRSELESIYVSANLERKAGKVVKTIPRVIITSDLNTNSGDPDDKQSMAHLFMYADEVEIVSIIPDRWKAHGIEATMTCIKAYEEDYNNPNYNFQKFDYPTPDYLRSIVQKSPETAVNSIISEAQKDDPRPLHVLVWGNMKTIRDALFKAPEIASKIRVYTIGTNLMAENPDAAANSKSKIEYGKRINWNGPGRNDIFNDPRYDHLWWVENDWSYNGMFEGEAPGKFLNEIKQHGALGHYIWECVQAWKWAHYFRAGDTPTLLYLLEPGVDINDPTQSSWAGKFIQPFPKKRPNYWIDDAGPYKWNYEHPSATWELAKPVYEHRVQTFVKNREGMYEAYRMKMAKLYNK